MTVVPASTHTRLGLVTVPTPQFVSTVALRGMLHTSAPDPLPLCWSRHMSVIIWITEGSWPVCVDTALSRTEPDEEIVLLYVHDDTVAASAHGDFVGLLDLGHPERDGRASFTAPYVHPERQQVPSAITESNRPTQVEPEPELVYILRRPSATPPPAARSRTGSSRDGRGSDRSGRGHVRVTG